MHRTTPRFWKCYQHLPAEVQDLADKSFELLKHNPRHPSLRFKRIGSIWSVRVGPAYRALAFEDRGDFTWVWIGPHDEYERLVRET